MWKGHYSNKLDVFAFFNYPLKTNQKTFGVISTSSNSGALIKIFILTKCNFILSHVIFSLTPIDLLSTLPCMGKYKMHAHRSHCYGFLEWNKRCGFELCKRNRWIIVNQPSYNGKNLVWHSRSIPRHRRLYRYSASLFHAHSTIIFWWQPKLVPHTACSDGKMTVDLENSPSRPLNVVHR